VKKEHSLNYAANMLLNKMNAGWTLIKLHQVDADCPRMLSGFAKSGHICSTGCEGTSGATCPDIFASIEKLFRKNLHRANPIVNHATMQGTTTPKRVDIWHRSFEPMMNYFAEAIANGTDKKMLFIKYESFCLHPEMEMKRFYDYLEIPAAKLDFANIEQTIKEDEEVYEYTGMLKIRPTLEMKPSDAQQVLGKDVHGGVINTYKFYNDYFGYK